MKGKLNIIYEEGEIDIEKPWTFYVQLRRWYGEAREADYIDYVLHTYYTTATADKVKMTILPGEYGLHEVISHGEIIQADSDGEAIHQAVDKFKQLAAMCIRAVG